MEVTTQQAEKICKSNQGFNQLGFTMLVTRLRRLYTENPTPATALTCAAEINKFLEKYHSIMSKDFEIITKL